jgi:hypothetical protein
MITYKMTCVIQWCIPKFFERLKCESKGENNGSKKSWGTVPSLQHLGG